ncbi:MAG: hypothetical protein ACR2IE_18790 [Candidatus Sumerlaeaceae bacterium]
MKTLPSGVTWIVFALLVGTMPLAGWAGPYAYKKELLPQLVADIPRILNDQETSTGRFGKGTWIVQDQHAIYPLSAAWSIQDEKNPYYHDPKVLNAIMAGGDALIEAQDKKGMWTFRKKDNSTWGQIYMPWTYSRWIRAYSIVRDAMPAERRARWDKALLLGFTGIEREAINDIQNIPAHDAMALYLAGQVFGRPEWSTTATNFMRKVAAAQQVGGYWTENVGPVVGYNFVYVDAIGTYYGMSHDKEVLPCLEKSSQFHSNFTYPDGTAIETIDERQVYHSAVSGAGVGFSFSPIGRGYMRRQIGLMKKGPGVDTIASLLLYGEEGAAVDPPALGERHYVSPDGMSLVHGQNGWCACLSAYHCPVPTSRWIQDRQNFVSLFHPAAGLIVGGGNTKLQPLWSTFSAGDVKLLFHKPGDEEPNFTPPPGIRHTPTNAQLSGSLVAMELEYDANRVTVRVELPTTTTARLTYSLDSEPTGTVEARVPLMPSMATAWKTASGKSGSLTTNSISLSSEEAGGWFEHGNWRVSLPAGSRLDWPALPHNPYRKDGSADAAEGRIVLTLPLKLRGDSHSVEVGVKAAPRPSAKHGG